MGGILDARINAPARFPVESDEENVQGTVNRTVNAQKEKIAASPLAHALERQATRSACRG